MRLDSARACLTVTTATGKIAPSDVEDVRLAIAIVRHRLAKWPETRDVKRRAELVRVYDGARKVLESAAA